MVDAILKKKSGNKAGWSGSGDEKDRDYYMNVMAASNVLEKLFSLISFGDDLILGKKHPSQVFSKSKEVCVEIAIGFSKIKDREIKSENDVNKKFQSFLHNTACRSTIEYSDILKVLLSSKLMDLATNVETHEEFETSVKAFGNILQDAYHKICQAIYNIVVLKENDFKKYLDSILFLKTGEMEYWKSFADLENVVLCYIIYSPQLMESYQIEPLYLSKFVKMRNSYRDKFSGYTGGSDELILDPVVESSFENIIKLSNTSRSLHVSKDLTSLEVIDKDIRLYEENLALFLHFSDDIPSFMKRLSSLRNILNNRDEDYGKSMSLYAFFVMVQSRIVQEDEGLMDKNRYYIERLKKIDALLAVFFDNLIKIILKSGIVSNTGLINETARKVSTIYFGYVEDIRMKQFHGWPYIEDVEELLFDHLSYDDKYLSEHGLSTSKITAFKEVMIKIREESTGD